MPLTAIAMWIIFVAGCAGALVAPLYGVMLYILVYQLNPETQWWGESFAAAGLRPCYTVALFTLVGIVLRKPRLPQGGRQLTPALWAALALLVYAFASLGWGVQYNERGAYQVEKFLKVLLFLMMLVRCVDSPRAYLLVLGAWLAGVAYIGYEAQGNVGIYQYGRLTNSFGAGDFADSSTLAGHMLATLPLIGALFFTVRPWLLRAGLLLIGALAVNTIVLTRTRSTVFGLAAMALVAVGALPRGYRRRGVIGIVVGTVLSFQLTDPGFWDRMSTIAHYQEDASARFRLDYWSAAVAIATDHPLGIGIGNFPNVVMDYVPGLKMQRSAHNTYMECLGELGPMGVTLLVLAYWLTLRSLRRTGRVARRDGGEPLTLMRGAVVFHVGWHEMALRCAMVCFAVCGLFITTIWAENIWMIVGLAACLENVAGELRAGTGHLPVLLVDGCPPGTPGATVRRRHPHVATGAAVVIEGVE
jgi:O-antigen ligase